jgi:uncharacterized membrane protein (DUF4010 family)
VAAVRPPDAVFTSMESLPLGILVAAIGGLAIGVERQWSGHATGPQAHFAGIRTFTLLGATAGVSGWLWTHHYEALATVLLAGAAGLVIVGYLAASRVDVDGTTEVSAIVVLAAGLLAGIGHLALASGIIAVTALVLLEKSRLHALATRLDDEELRAGARFAVMAVVILPLLPEGPYGPAPGIRPRELWIWVLLFSAISFAGYLARRAVGARAGYPLAGLFGGLVSSTNVTLAFARASRRATDFRSGLADGVVAACTMLYLRMAIATGVLRPELLVALWPYLTPPFLVGAAVLAVRTRQRSREGQTLETSRNPLQVLEALQMAAMFQFVLFGIELVRHWAGETGVVASGAVLGLTDLDALTLSMTRDGTAIPIAIAAQALAIGVIANTGLKIGITVVVGGAPEFRRPVVWTLGAMIAAILTGWLVVRSYAAL